MRSRIQVNCTMVTKCSKWYRFSTKYVDNNGSCATIEATGYFGYKGKNLEDYVTEENKAIAVFVAGLQNIPGWVALSRKKQDALLEHTSHIQQYRQMQMLGEFGELIELTQVQQLLDGEDMDMGDYLRTMYPMHHQRTIERKQKAFAELSATIPGTILKRITALGQDVLSRFDRIAGAALGDIRNALRQMPLLPVSTNEEAQKYLETLDTKLAEERKTRRRKGLHKDKGFSEKMATNALLHYLRESGLKTSAEKRQFLTRVIGWAMEAQAIHGTLRAARIAIPDGILIRRGRPPKIINAKKS